ncbi:MAG: hypothetical protein Q4F80_07250, partial [bacterium]|nr:hypothetical protein [bacterium]
AAISIPSVISNSQQQEFKTGLRKAVSVLNSAITMNMALDGESPYDNANLYGYLMKHMAVMHSGLLTERYMIAAGGQNPNGVNYFEKNYAFYTTDGMRFEFRYFQNSNKFKLHENPQIRLCDGGTAYGGSVTTTNWKGEPISISSCGGCGSLGLNNNTDGTTKPPCLIVADVNGDRKPNPQNASCNKTACSQENIYKYSDPDGKRLTDLFTVMITDKQAIPYGVAAQKAMYNSRK